MAAYHSHSAFIRNKLRISPALQQETVEEVTLKAIFGFSILIFFIVLVSVGLAGLIDTLYGVGDFVRLVTSFILVLMGGFGLWLIHRK